MSQKAGKSHAQTIDRIMATGGFDEYRAIGKNGHLILKRKGPKKTRRPGPYLTFVQVKK